MSGNVKATIIYGYVLCMAQIRLEKVVVLNFGLQRDSVEMVEGSGVVAKWEVIK